MNIVNAWRPFVCRFVDRTGQKRTFCSIAPFVPFALPRIPRKMRPLWDHIRAFARQFLIMCHFLLFHEYDVSYRSDAPAVPSPVTFSVLPCTSPTYPTVPRYPLPHPPQQERELTTEQEILGGYQSLQNQLQQILNKVAELESDLAEHNNVLDTLAPLDKSRKACRLVSGVLVERTVGEVIPSVTTNRDQLALLVTTLKKQMEAKQKEAVAFATKYKINFKGESRGAAGGSAASGDGNRGVLI